MRLYQYWYIVVNWFLSISLSASDLLLTHRFALCRAKRSFFFLSLLIFNLSGNAVELRVSCK